MDKHGIQNVGQATLVENYAKYGETIKPMKVLVSSTNHYSWPKACALTGIGSENMIPIPVDDNTRIDIEELQKVLTHCNDNEVPIWAVIGIGDSTEEGAVDEIGRIVEMRSLWEGSGLTFVIHADAAWGGYFASLMVSIPNAIPRSAKLPAVGALDIRVDVNDSVTIDPHKSGYVPYAVRYISCLPQCDFF
jgi:glutamate/tyrosine decarboxylase-like PLP-dependent enzyme